MMFSVVVPTHNRPKPLQRLLESLAKQSVDATQFEVIVIPSPNDASLPYLKQAKFPFRLRVHMPKVDPYSGKSASFKRNEGASAAAAEWIAFIDDDCEADPLWLNAAALHTNKVDLHGIEGYTEIPVPEKITLTYKGLQRLSEAEGYQTCNMFYRKKTFLELGGFDLKFPFYLEDTDLAWTFKDHQKNLMSLDTAVVRHPVPPPEPIRLIENAKRTRLIPYLYKKHRFLYETSGWRPISTSQWIYLILYLGTAYSVWASPHPLPTLIKLLGVILAVNAIYVFKLLRGCHFETGELLELFFYLPVTPVIALFQLIRGNIENRVFLIF